MAKSCPIFDAQFHNTFYLKHEKFLELLAWLKENAKKTDEEEWEEGEDCLTLNVAYRTENFWENLRRTPGVRMGDEHGRKKGSRHP